jgi:hypothetical protein
MSRSKTKTTWETRNQMFWWLRSLVAATSPLQSAACRIRQLSHEPSSSHRQTTKEHWPAHAQWCFAANAGQDIFLEINMFSTFLELHRNLSRGNEKGHRKQLKERFRNLSLEICAGKDKEGCWVVLLFSSPWLDIPSFGSILSIWWLPKHHASLHAPLPWEAHGSGVA